ncbi:MAG: M20/M25/M40 family metallo-hydrolase [Phycisphaerae bacterium]|nr:M20/M25/M40 family metallo-hydrolase [Phycisphaerae bacterium]
MRLPKILNELLSLPTAAFREDAVMEYLNERCAKLASVTCRHDRHGNLLAHYRHKPPKTMPLVFAAHTDHPAFVAREMLGRNRLLADFRGGVRPEFFPKTRVRFWTDTGPVRGAVIEVVQEKTPKRRPIVSLPKQAIIRVPTPIDAETIGMWDLPDPELRDGCVHARGCDDVAGVAAMLELLERLSKRKAMAETYCLFSRAEEVGFIGAIGAARNKTVPKRLPIIAIETSSELPNARIGDGPIMRVGDKASVFTPALTAFCQRVANDLQTRRKAFSYQRKLMDGGTCESTAYMAYGYDATGICLALGNYHNMNQRRRRIDSEYVSLADYQRMVDWFEALVRDKRGYVSGDADAAMRERLEQRFAQFEHLLGS